MMCACEADFARRFLPHQTRDAVALETQERLLVTLGFQPGVCNACRGLPEEAHPKAQGYGRTSKIARYYWREIWFEQTRRFAAWCDEQERSGHMMSDEARRAAYKSIENEVKRDIRLMHERSPKYTFAEECQSQTIANNDVEVLDLKAVYKKHTERKALIVDEDVTCSAEDFAIRHFERQGYHVLRTESIPFHAIFLVHFFGCLSKTPMIPKGDSSCLGAGKLSRKESPANRSGFRFPKISVLRRTLADGRTPLRSISPAC
jgi:hypothetical protein